MFQFQFGFFRYFEIGIDPFQNKFIIENKCSLQIAKYGEGKSRNILFVSIKTNEQTNLEQLENFLIWFFQIISWFLTGFVDLEIILLKLLVRDSEYRFFFAVVLLNFEKAS